MICPGPIRHYVSLDMNMPTVHNHYTAASNSYSKHYVTITGLLSPGIYED